MEKTMYIVRELQNSSSHRDPSYIFATSLKEAKKTAKKLQFFKGTVLTISNIDDERVAINVGKSWKDL